MSVGYEPAAEESRACEGKDPPVLALKSCWRQQGICTGAIPGISMAFRVRYPGSPHVHPDPGLSIKLRPAPHRSMLATSLVLALPQATPCPPALRSPPSPRGPPVNTRTPGLLECLLCTRHSSKYVTSSQAPSELGYR